MDRHVHGLADSRILLICKFNAIPIKVPARFFFKYSQNYSKIYIERQSNYNS